MSKPEIYGLDAKLQVLIAEASVSNTGRRVRRREIFLRRTKRQVSNPEQSGAGAELRSWARSDPWTGPRAQSVSVRSNP